MFSKAYEASRFPENPTPLSVNLQECSPLSENHTTPHVVGVAAQIHLAAVAPNMPYFEFPIAFPPSPLVENLLIPQFEISVDGTMSVPDRPGLGFELNEDVVSDFRVDPY